MHHHTYIRINKEKIIVCTTVDDVQYGQRKQRMNKCISICTEEQLLKESSKNDKWK
jgi:hypothetical protein